MVQQQDGDDWRRGRQQHSSSSCRSSSSPRRRQDLVADVRVDDVVVNKRRLCLAREREHVRLRAILLVLLSQAQLEVSPFEVLVLALHLFQLFAQLAGSSVSEHLPATLASQSKPAGRAQESSNGTGPRGSRAPQTPGGCRVRPCRVPKLARPLLTRLHALQVGASLGCTPCRLTRPTLLLVWARHRANWSAPWLS